MAAAFVAEAGIATGELIERCFPVKAIWVYREISHAAFAPIALQYSVAGVKLNIASTNKAYGRKHRRTMNSV